MTDKKPGFFKRLFGGEPPVQTPAPPETRPETPAPAPEPVAPTPAPPPDVVPEPEPVPLPGPPETTPDYVEDIEEQSTPQPQPEPVVETMAVAIDPPAMVEVPLEAPRQGWFVRLATGLKRSSDQLTGSITSVFTKRKLDAATLDELEDVLIQADLGIETATAISETLRRDRFDRDVSGEDVRAVLAAEVEKVLGPVALPLVIDPAQKPFVILMIGVNGSGKTTTIGKLAQKLAVEGKSVMLAAGDTFRAAAIEQLQVWGQRTNAPVITRPAGADASGLAYDAVTQAKAEGRDVLIIDTAGRLQNRDELMNELEKIIRVIKKVDPSAPHATLLTLDATTGQNALRQVEIFGQRAGVTGLVMTKLDGTARGGILVAIARKFGLPVHFIGVGESVGDLEPFTASDFARAIAGGE
ncbi:signal recognition particle-docking protein FtsY [Devosia sp. Root436]|uniref:signal recognition particle-docking protein FtsY n=1 Tax=Devosia sp. Root436 TaxID=1736537 RepID=UPI0006F7543E|nr:signal recognition particle-docking protein FtsY [Devosia sp. Root436]KQX38880.1 signal recognition particle-docking protein FtsY [Devosia sp. Root436]